MIRQGARIIGWISTGAVSAFCHYYAQGLWNVRRGAFVDVKNGIDCYSCSYMQDLSRSAGDYATLERAGQGSE